MSRAAQFVVCYLIVTLSIFGSTPDSSGSSRKSSEDLKCETVLEIGAHRVSLRTIDKYFRRFIEDKKRQCGREATSGERKEWLQAFLTKELIVAYAESEDFDKRPEILRIVSKTERYMLTQPQGPFYKVLYAEGLPTDHSLSDLYASAALVLDAKIAHYENESDYLSSLGQDFRNLNSNERTSRWQTVQKGYEIASCNGSIAWPFFPFPEIGSILAKEKTEKLFEIRIPEMGIYCGYIRSIQIRPLPVWESVRDQFAIQVKALDELVLLRKRRITCLFHSRFKFDFAVGNEVLKRLQTLPPTSPKIPNDFLSEVAHTRLASYHIGQTTISITVEDYKNDFNDLFIRRIPLSLSELRVGLEDMAIEEIDLLEARRRGIDSTPEFVDDRNGFTDLQVLELFENENALPKLVVTNTEIKAYQLSHVGLQLTEGSIRAALSDEKLKEWENSKAKAVVGLFKIDDYIDYTHYGLAFRDMQLPWRIVPSTDYKTPFP